VLYCGVLFFCVLIAVASCYKAPPRPVMPQYMMIEGTFFCSYSTGGPPCAGIANGVFRGAFQFDDYGNYMNYREDSVISNSSLIYNREYSFTDQTSEYFLTGNTTSLMCATFVGNSTFNRNLLANASYDGITEFNGIKLYTYTTTWLFLNVVQTITVYVTIDTEQFFAFIFGPVTYIYETITALNSFPPDYFTPPVLTCYRPPI